jgi:hypothetical protein
MAGPSTASRTDNRLAKALAGFSFGLGLAQLAVPGRFARAIGVPDSSGTRWLLRGLGLREIGSGFGILSQSRPEGWLWARSGGDAMDLALLGRALTAKKAKRSRVTAATAAVAGTMALDLLAGVRFASAGR